MASWYHIARRRCGKSRNYNKGLLAERGGFEPPVEFLTLRRFSKPLLSTTQPPLQAISGLFESYHGRKAGNIAKVCSVLFLIAISNLIGI